MTLTTLTRRALLLIPQRHLSRITLKPADTQPPPIVFVHGNGDSAAMWLTTVWRFESNGWPRERLVALDMPYPLARDADDKPQAGRSSADEQMKFLAAAGALGP